MYLNLIRNKPNLDLWPLLSDYDCLFRPDFKVYLNATQQSLPYWTRVVETMLERKRRGDLLLTTFKVLNRTHLSVDAKEQLAQILSVLFKSVSEPSFGKSKSFEQDEMWLRGLGNELVSLVLLNQLSRSSMLRMSALYKMQEVQRRFELVMWMNQFIALVAQQVQFRVDLSYPKPYEEQSVHQLKVHYMKSNMNLQECWDENKVWAILERVQIDKRCHFLWNIDRSIIPEATGDFYSTMVDYVDDLPELVRCQWKLKVQRPSLIPDASSGWRLSIKDSNGRTHWITHVTSGIRFYEACYLPVDVKALGSEGKQMFSLVCNDNKHMQPAFHYLMTLTKCSKFILDENVMLVISSFLDPVKDIHCL